MTLTQIESVIRGREIDVDGFKGKMVTVGSFTTRFLCWYEIMDRKAGNVSYILPAVVKIFDHTRVSLGRPLIVSSGYRTRKTQDGLVTKWGKAKFSPHTMGAALDIDTDTIEEAEKLRDELYNAANALGYEKPRIGIKKYKGNFVHFDMVFLHFKEFGGDFDYPDPDNETNEQFKESAEAIKRAWRPGVSW